MKLATHYNKVSILVTISVLFIGAIVYFFAIGQIAQGQLDRDLAEEIEEILEHVNVHQQIPKPVDFDEDQTTFLKIGSKRVETRFFDTVYHNPKAYKDKDGRAVEGSFYFKDQNYKFTIVISKESTEYLIQIITTITLALVVTLLLILFLANRFLLNDLWKPFYKLLKYLKDFNLSEPASFQLKNNKVDEFEELDGAIKVMASRVKHDYQNLKQFTENASHEMMTPLSVITSKLDTLIQDEALKTEQFEQINDIYEATSKLARLNHSLLLLVKIENDLIDDKEDLELSQIIIDKLRQFQELLSSGKITIQTVLHKKEINASSHLVEIMLNNLIGNAIRHNLYGGSLEIQLFAERLTISNTGVNNPLDPGFVFNRFSKDKNSEGTGLGLALIKNICTLYKWDISYRFDGRSHTFEILFN